MAEFEEGSGESQKVSKYNSGVAQIMRLDELWKDTHKHCRTGRLTLWNWDLDRVWCELAGDLEDEDKRVDTYNNFMIHIGEVQKQLQAKKISALDFQEQMYKILMQKEIFLRKLQNELGKGSAYLESDEDYMEG